MKVAILGNVGHQNYGDEAILEGLLLHLTEDLLIKKEQITVFSYNEKETRERHKINAVQLVVRRKNHVSTFFSTIKNLYIEMKGVHTLIIGGGGLLMDMYPKELPFYTIIITIAKILGIRCHFFAVGVGPIETRSGKKLVQYIVNRADSISVRDHTSKQLLEKLGIRKEVNIAVDPALRIKYSKKTVTGQNIKKIAVTFVPFHNEIYWPNGEREIYDNFIKHMADQIDLIIQNLDCKVLFISTKFPQDNVVANDVFKLIRQKENIEVIGKIYETEEILYHLSHVDLLIGTRLHSIILSCRVGIPFFGIGYQEKVKTFMSELDLLDFYEDINEFHIRNAMSEKIKQIDRNYDKIVERIEKSSVQLNKELSKNVILLGKICTRNG